LQNSLVVIREQEHLRGSVGLRLLPHSPANAGNLINNLVL